MRQHTCGGGWRCTCSSMISRSVGSSMPVLEAPTLRSFLIATTAFVSSLMALATTRCAASTGVRDRLTHVATLSAANASHTPSDATISAPPSMRLSNA